MSPSFQFDADGVSDLQVLWEDGERVFLSRWRADGEGGRSAVLAVLLAAERPPPAALDRLVHEYELRDALDAAWAARPLALSREGGRTALLLEDPGGEPLERLIGAPTDTDASCASPSASSPRWARRTSAASCTRTSSRPTSS